MKALIYLLRTQIKNKILMLRKKPGFLILYGFCLAIVILSVVMVLATGQEMNRMNFADERILFLILSGLSLFFLYTFVITGLSTGSSLFTMPDVGLLFVAPISSKKILLYGLISTMGKALLGSLFIFYQIGNLKTNFGYGFTEILALFIIFAILMLFCQLLSIGIYIFSNGSPSRKNLVKCIVYAAAGILLVAVIWIQRMEQISTFEALLRVVEARWFGFIPVAGWGTMFFIGVVHQSTSAVLISLVMFFVFGGMIIFLLTAGKADYYEDVLLSTEYTYQTRQAAKEGRNVPRMNRKKIKVRDNDLGIGGGSGAMTFMFKHMLELKRSSRFIFVDNYTIIMMVLVGIAGYNLKQKDAPEVVYYSVLTFTVYILFIMSVIGKLKTELMKPYIYLIPEKSWKKVLAASIISLLKPCIDGLLIFGVLTIAGGLNVIHGFFLAAAYAASGAVFTGITLLYQRLLGGQPNKLVQVFMGLLFLFTLMTPSIGASVAAAMLLPEAFQFLCVLPYIGFCLIFTMIIFAACGNLIDKAEFSGRA